MTISTVRCCLSIAIVVQCTVGIYVGHLNNYDKTPFQQVEYAEPLFISVVVLGLGLELSLRTHLKSLALNWP